MGFNIIRVRWPAFGDVFGEGLLLEPTQVRNQKTATEVPRFSVVAIPDADQTPGITSEIYRGIRFNPNSLVV
ncbi:MAG: hypothetical protein M2R45_02590 [Verrucomicrobia subdivision 3 bacterium]|nr:hypothetical protein [Limisphaerales bacterium]MCS1416440.1 hypothetical protein [Limisphaerales bacterium]